jgi:UDP:flavonoid glycosyltransferase YjiC (YdhE family)
MSTQEPIDLRVPFLGIPNYADQHLNLARIVSLGIRIQLGYEYITTGAVMWGLNEILNNHR